MVSTKHGELALAQSIYSDMEESACPFLEEQTSSLCSEGADTIKNFENLKTQFAEMLI